MVTSQILSWFWGIWGGLSLSSKTSTRYHQGLGLAAREHWTSVENIHPPSLLLFRLTPYLCFALQISTPDKVLIPERYVELEPDVPLSPEEIKEKQKKVERIKTLIAKSRCIANNKILLCPASYIFAFPLYHLVNGDTDQSPIQVSRYNVPFL